MKNIAFISTEDGLRVIHTKDIKRAFIDSFKHGEDCNLCRITIEYKDYDKNECKISNVFAVSPDGDMISLDEYMKKILDGGSNEYVFFTDIIESYNEMIERG